MYERRSRCLWCVVDRAIRVAKSTSDVSLNKWCTPFVLIIECLMIRCVILRVLATNYHRRYSTEALKYVKIGNVRASIRKPKSPHLVPVGFGK
uniref:Secreted protein n=1 Tax=Ascaris lumbricoides TaxID=6252 RepID=A0A0M3IPK5_ASCLU